MMMSTFVTNITVTGAFEIFEGDALTNMDSNRRSIPPSAQVAKQSLPNSGVTRYQFADLGLFKIFNKLSEFHLIVLLKYNLFTECILAKLPSSRH